jgi:site-specific DNA recombinase
MKAAFGLKILRKFFKYGMMWTALADRIICRFKTLRKTYSAIILFIFLNFCLLALSYCLDVWHLPIIQVMPSFLLTQMTIDKFFVEKSDTEKGVNDTGLEQFAHVDRLDSDARQEVVPVALALLFPIDKVIHLQNEGKKGAGYVRVSTRRQAQQGKSLKAQEEELIRLAESRGISTLYLFIDAKSGRNFSGRKLIAILQLAQLKEISEFLVSDIDRIGRETFELLGFMLQLRALGVLTITPKEEIDLKSLMHLVLASFKAYGAQEENARRTYAALRSQIHNFKNHMWNMHVPFGYRKAEKWIEKIPEYKPIIKDIFNCFLEYGDYSKVAESVNAKYRDLLQKPLNPELVARILTNPVFIGKPTFGGEKVNARARACSLLPDMQVCYGI